MTIDKTFDPAAIEARWYPHWEEGGLFRPARDDAQPFTIVIPPPNVTGSLHLGHALDVTLQDILVRHARLRGKDALWVVGTDHAGIATQMVVERNLASQGIKRADMTREQFVEHVWEWKAQSGGAITRQLRRLGASCDWANEKFTMDEGLSRAVTRAFVQLYNEGLLYRDKRLVNWDPHFRTAISDLEVEQREVRGHFWHFRYPLADGSGHIAIATTRPETILGDGAVAVNPDDDRYRHLVGKKCLLPIVGRLIPIIADDHVKMDFGSGAVKITAAHDHNDYDVYKRHPEARIPLINLMNADATMSDACPDAYRGLDRYVARAKVVAEFAALGLLEKVDDHVHMVPYGDRSGVVIEPWLTDQWYVDAKTLAGPALEAVRSGDIRVVPETWKKTWYQWLENIQPWCVSRQLWWGHRIPVWYGPSLDADGQPNHGDVISVNADWEPVSREPIPQQSFVCESEEDALQAAAAAYPKHFEIMTAASREERDLNRPNTIWLTRDTDVLDTWFSSALWPFATLGWPGDGDLPRAGEDLLSRHYPNDILISGFDILFFWDARMAMQGLHFMGGKPWKTLYLHGLVRAPDGSKMSKSKGNTVDPLGLIDRYGADALRFTLAAMESQGRDIKLDEKRVEGYRNFATKLWNAARFARGQGIGGSATLEPPPADLAINKWIVAETQKTIQALDLALADPRYDEAANTIYHFVWDRFCDWYLELIKPVLIGGEGPTPQSVHAEPGEAPPFSLTEREEGSAALRQAQGERCEDSAALETRAVAGWVLDQILVLLHPFMPFITEELWHALAEREHDLIVASWPRADARAIDPEATAEVEWLIRLVGEIRAARSELNVPPSTKLQLYVYNDEVPLRDRVNRHADVIMRMGRLSRVRFTRAVGMFTPDGGWDGDGPAITVVVDNVSYKMPLEGVIDLAAERARLAKAAAAAEKERDGLAARLGNAAFTEKAKPEAVAKARDDQAAKAAEAERLRAALARLG